MQCRNIGVHSSTPFEHNECSIAVWAEGEVDSDHSCRLHSNYRRQRKKEREREREREREGSG
jgi:hypothetical protein